MSDTETADTGASGGGEQQTTATTTADTTTTTATDTAQTQNQTDTQTDTQKAADQKTTTEQTAEFKLPDAFKDKPWASKIKSQDDLYKQLDNLQTAVGKKALYPAADATPEEWDAYLAGMRPESAEAYDFGAEPNEEFVAAISPILLEAGISKHQAGKLIPAYQKFEQAVLEEQTSAEGFKAEMSKSFGDKYEANVAAIVKEHKQHLTPEDQAAMDKIPNAYLGLIYRLTNAMQKAYGANENGDAHTEKSGAPVGEDIGKVRSELRQKIAALETRPHSAAEKQKLVDDLQATYNEGKK